MTQFVRKLVNDLDIRSILGYEDDGVGPLCLRVSLCWQYAKDRVGIYGVVAENISEDIPDFEQDAGHILTHFERVTIGEQFPHDSIIKNDREDIHKKHLSAFNGGANPPESVYHSM